MSNKKDDNKILNGPGRMTVFKKTPKVFSMEQIIELIELSNNGPNGMRNKCIIALLAATGLRVNELCHLKISDYDFDKQTIKVRYRDPSMRKIPISSSVGEIINNYIKLTFGFHVNEIPKNKFMDFYLFPYKSENTPTSSSVIQILIINLIKKAKTIPEEAKYIGGDPFFKIQAYGPSSFRHTYIINLLREERPLPTILYLTGLSSLSRLTFLKHLNLENPIVE